MMIEDKPDWIRLQKALSVETERGFINLQGKQYLFNEFLTLTFGKFPVGLPSDERRRWLDFSAKFASYPNLETEHRKRLVVEARRYLYSLQQGERAAEEKANPKPKVIQVPKTKVVAEVSRRLAPELEKKLIDLPEIGFKKAAKLYRLGIATVRDLLYYFPRDHIDYANQVCIAELQAGETVTIIATVKRCNCFSSPKNKKLSILEIKLKDNTGIIKICRLYSGNRNSGRGWKESMKRRYVAGSTVAACGLVKESRYGLTLDNPELEVLANPEDEIESLTVGRVVPVYALTEGVVASTVRQAVISALPATALLKEPLPKGLRAKYQLMELKDAINNIHFPPDADSLRAARRRLVFDELYYLQLGLLQRQQKAREAQTSAILAPQGELLEQFHEILPFKLTGAQERVIKDILNDLQKPAAMNRLVQGDVGSGKTVVAVVAIIAAIQSGYQAALMAPTEVLAEQHYRK